MGVVWTAHDPELDRPVAIKLLTSPRSDSQARLLREAQAMAKLAHPNVVAVFDVGLHLGQVYVAMELVLGATLRAWIDADPRRPWRTILGMFLQAGRGLAAAHAAGLVHREHKPAPCNPASQPDAPSISKDLAGLQGAGLPRVAPRCPGPWQPSGKGSGARRSRALRKLVPMLPGCRGRLAQVAGVEAELGQVAGSRLSSPQLGQVAVSRPGSPRSPARPGRGCPRSRPVVGVEAGLAQVAGVPGLDSLPDFCHGPGQRGATRGNAGQAGPL